MDGVVCSPETETWSPVYGTIGGGEWKHSKVGLSRGKLGYWSVPLRGTLRHCFLLPLIFASPGHEVRSFLCHILPP